MNVESWSNLHHRESLISIPAQNHQTVEKTEMFMIFRLILYTIVYTPWGMIPYCFWIGLGTVPGGIRVVNDEETIGLKTQGDIENQTPSNREHVLHDYV